ncbi:MAG: SirB2 family protein [Rhodocyclaceae bacterium]|nr:SirB2 family protein [Rhodocyclaceae bacterium]
MDYATLKLIHVTCAVASAMGFLARAFVSLWRPDMLPRRGPVHALPHVVDTVLLASAVGMVWLSGGELLRMPWLQAKVVLLLGYIVLGARALSPTRTGRDRVVSLALAIAAFGGIVLSATSKNVLGVTGG